VNGITGADTRSTRYVSISVGYVVIKLTRSEISMIIIINDIEDIQLVNISVTELQLEQDRSHPEADFGHRQ
jgi:energy-converting hydrogenase Eha subunit H